MGGSNHSFVRVALIFGILQTVASGSVNWSGWSGSSSQSENYDSSKTLDGFSALCTLNWEDCLYSGLGIKIGCSDNNETKACSCSISSNPASGLFYMSGSTSQWYIKKNPCTAPTCGNYPSGSTCSTSNGCASAGTYSISIRCSGSNSRDSTSSTRTHTTTFTAESPSFSITNLDATTSASRTQGSGTVLFSTTTTTGLAVYQWVESSSVANSWLLSTGRLFRLNTGNGQVYINSNPSDEYSWTYSMDICAYSRRQSDCGTLTIQFSGCYQRPTCNGQTNTVADTFAVGGMLFNMVVPDLTDHFTTASFISSSFTGLSFTITSTTLSVASINSSTGVIISTGNVTVFPSYPNKVYTMVVRISNTESCSYTSTCTMTLIATFTNWPIEIQSLNTSVAIHEDTDKRTRLHTIITQDYNYEWEDNVTCVETYNSDPTLLELVHDGSYNYNSYSIYKKRCTAPGCGRLCNLNIGCLSHNITQQYTLSVRCSDAYGSFDDGTLTINIQRNAAPVWTNLPNTTVINTNETSDTDVLYTFYYSDLENETLNYNFTVFPAQPSPPLFSFQTVGTNYANPANMTSLRNHWPLTSMSYSVYVCGSDRRSTICETLTIKIRASSSVTWSGWSGSSSQSENYDNSKTLDGFSASCTLNWEDCWYTSLGIKLGCSEESETKACFCSISSNPASGLFYLSGNTSQWYINKNPCSATSCGNYPSGRNCSTLNGCASAGTYSITITCSESNSHDNTSSTRIHTTTFTAESPSFSITNLDATTSASRTQGSGTVLFSTTTTTGLAVYQWVESSSVANSWLLSTGRLFRLKTGNGQVYINSNPSDEYSWTFSMDICAYSRRQSDCGTLTIQFSGCYQGPTCNDQTNTVGDTFAVGRMLFNMIVPDPTDHFTTTSFISSSFTGLSFTMTETTLAVASINSTTGVIITTGNVRVFPSYPNKVYTMVVKVSNTESCSYTSTCTMTLTATFTNWPIEIRSLDTSVAIHEDTDNRTRLHTIITHDYNYKWEDNVTCVETYNSDSTLLELVHEGNYNYSSYSIYKKRCTDPGCGWLCYLNTGCLSNNITQQYTISVRCSDAYGSVDDGTLTVNIQRNAAPLWTNLPNTIVINTKETSDTDGLYTFYYSDLENETLNYNFTVFPPQPSPPLFSFQTVGTNYDNPANLTFLRNNWPSGNMAYTVYVCGSDRRNTICETLTIEINEESVESEPNIRNVTDIILGVVGSIMVFALIICVIVKTRSRCRPFEDTNSGYITPMSDARDMPGSNESNANANMGNDIELAEEVTPGEEEAEGHYSEIYL